MGGTTEFFPVTVAQPLKVALVAWVLRQDLEPASPVVVLVDAISAS